MKARMNRARIALSGVVVLGGLLAAPTAAQAQPNLGQAQSQVSAETTASGCQVTGGTLKWGVKESFRSYISGSIANGKWETSDGANYETPSFQWSNATGSIDPETGTGSVSFVGTLRFTGHNGLLDLTLANPTIEFEGDGKAALMLDSRSTDTTGAVVVDTQQEWVGEVKAPNALSPADSKLTLDKMQTKLTGSGAKAFAGFYEAGVELDPLNLALEFQSCDAAAAKPAGDKSEPKTAGPAQQQVQTDEGRIPWLPISIGGVAILVIGVTGGMLLAGRGKGKTAGASVEGPASH